MSGRSVSLETQYELAMLWNSLNILRNLEKSNIISFFNELSGFLMKTKKLSLSVYWDKIYKALPENNIVTDSYYKVEDIEHKFLDTPELKYLKKKKSKNFNHDPLGVVQNLFALAYSYISNSEISDQNKLIKTLLLIAIKSGRISLLLQCIWILKNLDVSKLSLEPTVIEDLRDSMKRETEEQLHPNSTGEEISEDDNKNDSLKSKGIASSDSGILLSFGKADHGYIQFIHISFL